MANSANVEQHIFGRDPFSYYAPPEDPTLIADIEAILTRIAVATQNNIPTAWEGVFGIALAEDIGGNKVVAFEAEAAINPAVER